MGSFRTFIGDTAKSFVDVPSWLGYKYLKANAISICNQIKAIVNSMRNVNKQKFREETFEQAIERLNLSEKDLQKKLRVFAYQFFGYLFLAFCGLAYTFYLFYGYKIFAGMITFLISLILFVRCYISLFWRFQIKNRKLGCTFKEWLHNRVDQTTNEENK